MKKLLRCAAALVSFSLAAQAQAFTVDPKVYFAVATYQGSHILISKKACGDSQANKDGWRLAEIAPVSHEQGQPTPACWKKIVEPEPFGASIQACIVYQGKGNPDMCLSVNPARFIETKSLPKSVF